MMLMQTHKLAHQLLTLLRRNFFHWIIILQRKVLPSLPVLQTSGNVVPAADIFFLIACFSAPVALSVVRCRISRGTLVDPG